MFVPSQGLNTMHDMHTEHKNNAICNYIKTERGNSKSDSTKFKCLYSINSHMGQQRIMDFLRKRK
jgi:hypothetical protein